MILRSLSFLLLVSALTFGNTYYIDYASGSDANAGTSKSAPWKRVPGMTGCTSTYTHTAGDVFVFKGGVIWPSAALPLTITSSGNSTGPDRYTTDPTWYAGSAWSQPTLDGELFGKTLLSMTNTSYVLINDIRFVNAGALTANGIMAFTFINCSDLELSNNTFAPEAWGCLYISAEKTGTYSNILIHHNDLSRCAFGIRVIPSAPAAIMRNVQIYNNNIHDFHSQLSGDVHGDGIQHYCSPDNATSYDRYIDGFKIFNNRFYGDFTQVAGSRGAMTALIYLSGSSTGVEVYNNLFAPYTAGSQSPNFFESFISLRDNPNRGGHHKIYNNTFVTKVANGQAAAILEDDLRLPTPALDIKNNIFSNFDWPFDLRSTNHTIDHNNYKFVKDMGKWAGNFVGTFANWQNLGLDAHGISATPEFVSTTDYHLSPTSPCVGTGVNLSTVIATDLEGISRPANSAFSLGVYERAGVVVPPVTPAAPTLAVPVNGASGIGVTPTLSWNAVSGAASYSVQVSTVADFATTIINQTGVAATSTVVSALPENTPYYWRVNAVNVSGTSGWSVSGTFTTASMGTPPSTLPAAVTLWWPANGATGIVSDPTLSWSPDTGAVVYTVQVSTTSDFATKLVNQGEITAGTFTPNHLSHNSSYYWRVCASSASGLSDWSSVSRFTVYAPPSTGIIGCGVARALPQELGVAPYTGAAVQVSLPRGGAYSLTIYSMNGQKVGTLAMSNGSAGYHVVSLSSLKVFSGFYLVQLHSNGNSATKKVFIGK